jgi:hypothetical protein
LNNAAMMMSCYSPKTPSYGYLMSVRYSMSDYRPKNARLRNVHRLRGQNWVE